MWSRGGSLFKSVVQEGTDEKACNSDTRSHGPCPQSQFLPPGPFGSWNGGLIDGVEAGGVRLGVYEYAVVHTVTNLCVHRRLHSGSTNSAFQDTVADTNLT
jgi:hypothetical protein